jgi:hypothetical protein
VEELKVGDLVSAHGIYCLVVELKNNDSSGCEGAVVQLPQYSRWKQKFLWVNKVYLEKISEYA